MSTVIVGAGLAGLIAGASAFPRAKIVEAGPEQQATHKAVLRFRSSAVGDATGIAFKKVKVNKGLYANGHFVQPNIRYSNWYSHKVVQRLADRSIWNLDPAERWVAPDDLISQLIERCSNRIEWNCKVEKLEKGMISTMPMNVAAKIIGRADVPDFKYAPINVQRWLIPDAAVYQTIYFPAPYTSVYRASITGDMLIVESVEEPDQDMITEVFEAFGLYEGATTPLEKVNQRYGKIAPIDEGWRRNFIYDLTRKHGVYSLGRFATWRNALLDDLIHDTHVIKKLISGDEYQASLMA